MLVYQRVDPRIGFKEQSILPVYYPQFPGSETTENLAQYLQFFKVQCARIQSKSPSLCIPSGNQPWHFKIPHQNRWFSKPKPLCHAGISQIFPRSPHSFPIKTFIFRTAKAMCHHVARSPRRSPVVASDFDQVVATRRCWNLQEATVFNGKAMENMERHVTLMLTHGGFLN